MNELKINQPKPLIYQGRERVVMAVNGIRKHFIQCLFRSLRTQMLLNSGYFSTSLILFSMARWAGCHWKITEFHFPILIARQYKSICWRTQSFYSQSPSDSNITVLSKPLSFSPHQRFQTVLSFALLQKDHSWMAVVFQENMQVSKYIT